MFFFLNSSFLFFVIFLLIFFLNYIVRFNIFFPWLLLKFLFFIFLLDILDMSILQSLNI